MNNLTNAALQEVSGKPTGKLAKWTELNVKECEEPY